MYRSTFAELDSPACTPTRPPVRRPYPQVVAIVILSGFLSGSIATELSAQGDCNCLDVVLTVDQTGDMRHVVRALRQNASTVTGAVAQASGDARMGLVTFRGAVFVEHDLSADLASVEAAIAGLNASGGAEDPENWDGAADYAANREPLPQDGPACSINGVLDDFRPTCRRLVVVFTNAPPGGCNDDYVDGLDDVHAQGVATLASANGITISTVLSDNGHLVTSAYPDGVEPTLLQFVASETGGTFAVVPDRGDGGVVAIRDAILDACAGVCGDGICGPGEGSCSCPEDCGFPATTETSCSNGIDDDCDGLVDCEDSDCSLDPFCDVTCGGNKAPCEVDADCCSFNCKGGQCKGGGDGSGGSVPFFIRGDVNSDGEVDLADAATSLNWLLAGAAVPGCLATLNANGDGAVDLADPVFLLGFLFAGGPSIAAPFPECGPGALPADFALGCVSQGSCQ